MVVLVGVGGVGVGVGGPGVVGVGVVGVGVVGVGVVGAVPPAVGTEEPVPTAVRVAVGVEPPPCGDELLATRAFTGDTGVPPLETWAVPLGWLPTPELLGPEVSVGAPPAELGGVVVGVVPKSGRTGRAELAESTGGAIGPEPMLTPATTDRAAAAKAPDAMKRFRTKYSVGAATAAAATARAGT